MIKTRLTIAACHPSKYPSVESTEEKLEEGRIRVVAKKRERKNGTEQRTMITS